MTDHRSRLVVGARVLTASGVAVVESFLRDGVRLEGIQGSRDVPWADLGPIQVADGVDGGFEAIHEELRPFWELLPETARADALFKLEVVQEIVTGYRDGHPLFARPGEPFKPFGPIWDTALTVRCARMAKLLTDERRRDRGLERKVVALGGGEIRPVGASTVSSWVQRWLRDGLLGLIDGRLARQVAWLPALDGPVRRIADEVVGALDGSPSAVNIGELTRRVLVGLKAEGLDTSVPGAALGKYLSLAIQARGATPRAQKSYAERRVAAAKHYPAVRPGQVVAIDVTRADNLVRDALSGRAISVEIITAIDVCSRVILALRVVPRSADGLDTGLLLYDVLRPFSQVVSGTDIGDWRWAGIPGSLDLTGLIRPRPGNQQGAGTSGTQSTPDSVSHDTARIEPASANGRILRGHVVPGRDLDGEHGIPGLVPDGIRVDHGKIFMSAHVRGLLRDFGIDLLPSRIGKSTDNSHIERWHETLQRAVQQIPGYKGRNTTQRGRLVAAEPLLTAIELQTHLRRFVALDYHRSWHQGIIIAGAEKARLTPLELFDCAMRAAGRLDVPQRPDLLYQFLPIRWGKIGRAGVEFNNLVYDSRVLDPYRPSCQGQFRRRDAAAPFFYDPHDVSRIWFADPDPDPDSGRFGEVTEIPWRGIDQLLVPMNEVLRDAALARIRERGGNAVLQRDTAVREIVDQLGELTASPRKRKERAATSAAALRVAQSRADHEQAQEVIRASLGTGRSPEPGADSEGQRRMAVVDTPPGAGKRQNAQHDLAETPDAARVTRASGGVPGLHSVYDDAWGE